MQFELATEYWRIMKKLLILSDWNWPDSGIRNMAGYISKQVTGF